MAAKGIETRVATVDADTYIVRCGSAKATSHNIDAIIGQEVDLVVLLIAFASPESIIYCMKPGKRKVEAKLFSNGICTNSTPLEEEKFEFDQVVEESGEIRLRASVKVIYAYFYVGRLLVYRLGY
ncbi:hypothetical protein AVEN_62539-1 [Araneus ventricosus]|uniref:Uncharacterized protein n=1 Tax=Araneus ventricosus TaxID=182803 RepID=A0A4Y2UMI1_ARAVE|nr:hypothetical protein AVEN_62539-1 [Araneus ventricosus]